MAFVEVFDVGYPVYYGRKIDEFTSDLILGLVVRVHKSASGNLYDIKLCDSRNTVVTQVPSEHCNNPFNRMPIWNTLKHLDANKKTNLTKAMKFEFEMAVKKFMTDEPEDEV